jgi:hypothetical protein
MFMPETGFFFPGLLLIPHPEDGERKIHLNGWMGGASSAPQAIFSRIKSGCSSILSVDFFRIAHFHLTISPKRESKDFHVQ